MPEEHREDGRIVLSDPRAIRALAHPARLALIEALLPGQELTATEAAALTGLSPSATSYHLKALAKWGIVEAGQPRPDGRDRPWKATGRSIEMSSQVPRATVLAEIAMLDAVLDRIRALVTGFLERQANEPEPWRDALELANGDYWLTAPELAEISRALRSVLEPYKRRARDARPANSRRVRVTRLLVPRADSEEEDAGPGEAGPGTVAGDAGRGSARPEDPAP